MLTGELRSQVDAIWNAFWSGGISNPMEVLEQITYLLFIRRLDDAHTLEENKALMLGKPIENRVFPAGADERGRDYQELRWSRFKNFAPAEMYKVVGEHVFSRSSQYTRQSTVLPQGLPWWRALSYSSPKPWRGFNAM